jgi:hypothetical protein
MATAAQIRTRVRGYYKADYPTCTDESQFKKDFGLNDAEIEQKNTGLAIELGCDPTRSQIMAAKSIGALIQLFIDTRMSTKGVVLLTARTAFRL